VGRFATVAQSDNGANPDKLRITINENVTQRLINDTLNASTKAATIVQISYPFELSALPRIRWV